MINWDPAAQTALSDEEVISKPQKGSLYFVRYEIVDEPGRFLEVATTRPETIMADTGVAVHPNDKRYADLVGKHVWRPLAREKIPIVADEAIDPEFGTGVLKVTPAHDKVDFEIGQRHKLPVIDVLQPNGRINCPAVPELDGLDRFEARKKAAELLQERGLLAKAEPLREQRRLQRSQRRADRAAPERAMVSALSEDEGSARGGARTSDPFLSRSIGKKFTRNGWRTFRIGASAGRFGGDIAFRRGIRSRNRRSEIRSQKFMSGSSRRPIRRIGRRIADTLDTWFSSWLWAYETMDRGDAEEILSDVGSRDRAGHYFLLGRAHDHCRAGIQARANPNAIEDNIPFRDVFFTGLIRDKQGRKMSKSLGNSPDPLDLIAKYGADGLRFGLMRIAPSGQDIRFDEKQIEEGRNFATKLWNAARFRQMHGPSEAEPEIERARAFDLRDRSSGAFE